MAKQISVGQALFAVVDDEDFERVAKLRWHPDKNPTTTYAARHIKEHGKTKKLYMHRYVLGEPPGMEVDHVNGNGLDNRRCNLRSATRMQNAMNMRMHRDNKSGVKGVSWCAGMRKWKPEISANGVRYRHLGYYADLEDAKAVRECAEHLLHGEFAKR